MIQVFSSFSLRFLRALCASAVNTVKDPDVLSLHHSSKKWPPGQKNGRPDSSNPSGFTGGYPFEETPAGAFLSEHCHRRNLNPNGYGF
jgi:hypothetical protein